MGSLADKIHEALEPEYGALSTGHLLKEHHDANEVYGRDEIRAFYVDATEGVGSNADLMLEYYTNFEPEE